MKKALTYVVFVDILFILLLSFSAMFSGVVADLIYYAAFLIPLLAAYLLRRLLDLRSVSLRLSASRRALAMTLAMAAPTLLIVFGISFLTSLLLSFVGEGSVSDVSGSIFSVILTHAIITPVLEEALFRYVPIVFIAPYSRRGAIIFSALFFALVHCNMYQIPYALFAGIVFATLDVAFESITPSLILHFLNNLISIFWIRGSTSSSFAIAYIIILASAALLSLLPIFLMRRQYRARLSSIVREDGKIEFSYETVIFAAATLLVACLAL